MSQSEGGEYPLPALFCKVTSHFVFVFVFWIFLYFYLKGWLCWSKIRQISPELTELPIFKSRLFLDSFFPACQTFYLFSLPPCISTCPVGYNYNVQPSFKSVDGKYYDLKFFGKSCSPQMTGFYMLLCTVAGVLTLSAISFDRSLPSSSSAHLFSWLSWFLSGLWL